ncbi:hypothetical protein RhiJN_27739 [Ceratobasidium sp. AG-Ba]|nr:hypothetical protein RhiJN_27739 [Ceratobasidium sp. AG-Ba]
MVSLSSGLRRIKLFFTAKTNPDVFIGAAEPFNEYFFPGHLINKSEPIAPPESHSPHWLLVHIADNPRARDSVGSISITEISYYKDKKMAQHEFLVFRIEDSHRPLANYIRIDRRTPKGKGHDRPPSPTDDEDITSEPLAREHSGSTGASLWHATTTQPNLMSSSSPPSLDTRNARDMVHVSSGGSLKSIVDRNASTRLGVIKVSRDETVKKPTLEDVLLIADLFSETQPHYRLLRAQCYWYAYMIWKLLLFSFEDSFRFEGPLGKTGTHRLMPWIEWHQQSTHREDIELAERQTFASMTAGYLSKLNGFEKAIAERNHSVIFASESRALGEEIIRLKEEIARVKEAASTAVVQEAIETPEVQSPLADNRP